MSVGNSEARAILFVRSLLFNLAFYLLTIVMLVASLPFYFILPQAFAMWVVRTWARAGIFLLRMIAGTRVEIRGRQNVPPGAVLVAAKHQSMLETFALVPLFANPTYVMKSQIKWIPIFGQYTIKAGMIHVDREGGMPALRKLAVRCREEFAKGRQILIFPEGTRRPPGAPPAYQSGVAHLYRALDVSALPIALNSGLYWPRRKFLRYPGTIVIECLAPIPPGLDSRTFLVRLSETIEAASDRLLVEAARTQPRPPFPESAAARLAALGAG
jgi:1-acyl-sn-glycerol-3-phosphate acyltransferase